MFCLQYMLNCCLIKGTWTTACAWRRCAADFAGLIICLCTELNYRQGLRFIRSVVPLCLSYFWCGFSEHQPPRLRNIIGNLCLEINGIVIYHTERSSLIFLYFFSGLIFSGTQCYSTSLQFKLAFCSFSCYLWSFSQPLLLHLLYVSFMNVLNRRLHRSIR